MLAFAMRHRLAVSLIALAVVFSASSVSRGEAGVYPTNVDEAEFEVSVNVLKARTWPVMNEAMQAIEKDILSRPACRAWCSLRRRSFLGASIRAAHMFASRHMRNARSHLDFFGQKRRRQPAECFQGKLSQQDVMLRCGGRLPEILAMRTGVRQCTFFQFWRRADVRHRFQLRGPDIVALAATQMMLIERSQTLGGIWSMPTLHSRLNKPSCASRLIRARAADLALTAPTLPPRSDDGGRRRSRSRYRDESINEDYDVQLRLTGTAATFAHIQVFTALIRARPGRLDNLVNI